MNTQTNLKEPDFRENTPLLDEDFDLFSSEVVDLILFQREPKNTDRYMIEFKTQTR